MTDAGDLATLIERLSGAQVLCVGDAMLDRFIYGKVDRISPEAPVPVFAMERETAMLGGAGNVVRNVVALAAEACFVSVIGRDPAGTELTRLLSNEMAVESNLVTDRDRPTTIKVRYVAGTQQLLRADSETTALLSEELQAQILLRAEAGLAHAGALVLSDYGKGVLSDAMLARLIAAARKQGRPVVVDPKGPDYSHYRGADLVTPNRRELSEATGMATDSDEEVVAAARSMIRDCGIGAVLVTRSEHGMTLVVGDAEDGVTHVPARAQEVADVSGAGDTVVAMLATALASGIELVDAVRLANVAAGIVVSKLGTAVATSSEVSQALRATDMNLIEAKTLPLDALLNQIAAWRGDGKRVGFTNGCFDILHPGHISLLRQAREACDKLVVGLNSDASVRRLKGEERPVQSEAARGIVIGSLESVDAVVIFGEDTPFELISQIRPDVLVKGADYTVETVVGADVVQSYGGKVVLARLAEGHSTTRTIERIAAGK